MRGCFTSLSRVVGYRGTRAPNYQDNRSAGAQSVSQGGKTRTMPPAVWSVLKGLFWLGVIVTLFVGTEEGRQAVGLAFGLVLDVLGWIAVAVYEGLTGLLSGGATAPSVEPAPTTAP